MSPYTRDEQELKNDVLSRFPQECESLKPAIERWPVAEWEEKIPRLQGDTLCVKCFMKGRYWKKTVVQNHH